MIEEIYIKSKNIYAYVLTDGTVFLLKEKYTGELHFKSQKKFEEIVKNIEELSYSQVSLATKVEINETKSQNKKRRNYNYVSPLLFSIYALLLVAFSKDDIHSCFNEWKFNQLAKTFLETQDEQVLQELETFSLNHGFSEKYESVYENYVYTTYLDMVKNLENSENPIALLQRIYNYRNLHELYDSKYDDLLLHEIFKGYSSGLDAFYHYVSLAIQNNPYFSEEEKQILTAKYQEVIHNYGHFYSSKSIIETIVSLSLCDTQTRYGLYTATHCNGFITYDPSWKNYENTLLHECIHTNGNNIECLSIYKEPIASILSSTPSYSKERALMTMLGILGEEEEVFYHLLNLNPDGIWKSISKNPSLNQNEVNYLRYLVENTQEDTQILSIIQDFYERIYTSPWQENAVMKILSNIYLNNTEDYSNVDSVVLNGNFPVQFRINEYTTTYSIPLGVCSTEAIPYYWKDCILNFLNDPANKEIDYVYYIEHTLGSEIFNELQKTKDFDFNKIMRIKTTIVAIQDKNISYLVTQYETLHINKFENMDLNEFDDFLRHLNALKDDNTDLYSYFSSVYKEIFPEDLKEKSLTTTLSK